MPELVNDLFNSLDAVLHWMTGLRPVWAYLMVFAISYGENICPPIPGDMIVVFGGYLAGAGTLSLPLVIGLATLGGGLGFMTVYAVGRRFGPAVLEEERFRWMPQESLRKARGWLRRWGYGVVAANRFLTGARSVIALAVGMAEMEAGRTALWATVSAAAWCALIAYAGHALGENWHLIRGYLSDYSQVMLALLGAALLAWVVYRFVGARSTPEA